MNTLFGVNIRALESVRTCCGPPVHGITPVTLVGRKVPMTEVGCWFNLDNQFCTWMLMFPMSGGIGRTRAVWCGGGKRFSRSSGVFTNLMRENRGEIGSGVLCNLARGM